MPDSFSTRKRAWIFAIAYAVAMSNPIATALADTPSHGSSAEHLQRVGRTTAEPFGLATSALPAGPLQTKWRDVERAIERDLEIIALCRSDRTACPSPQALHFLMIVDSARAQSGLGRVGEINRAFNLAIRPISDLTQYGVEDFWTSPLATLTSGAGDCEDYAIAKLVALRGAGLSADDVRLVILREVSGEDHAVVAARVDGRWRILDNRFFLMLEDSDVTKYQPVFAVDAEGAKRFEQPSIAMASTTFTTPASSNIAMIEHSDASLTTSAISVAGSASADIDFWPTNAM